MGDDADALETEDIEISDVPSEEAPTTSPLLVALGSHISPRSPAWRWTTTLGAVVLVVLVVLGSFPSLLDQASQLLRHPGALVLTAHEQASFYYTNSSAVAENSTLASLPLNCPAVAAPQNFDPATFPPGVGASPIWITGLSGPPLLVHREDINPSQDYGWAYHVLLVVKSDYSDAVLLSGGSLHDDFPLLFDKEIVPQGQSPVTAFFQLNTQHPDFPSQYGDEHWKAWEIRLYVPSAGCYYLQAEWLGGSWKVNFATTL